MVRPVAALREVTKAYPGVMACRAVTIEFHAGEIHAVVGQNGAGKTTLVKILGGLLQPDAGWVEIDGKRVVFRHPRMARRAGVGVVHQNSALIDTLSVIDNLALATRGTATADLGDLPSWAKQIGLARLVGQLSLKERRLIEIEKCLRGGARTIILDEPTAALTQQEAETLFQVLRSLTRSSCAVIVVSHKLQELVQHADRFTVLRKGEVVARLARADASIGRLVELITGSSSANGGEAKPDPGNARADRRLLGRLSNLSTRCGAEGDVPLRGMDLSLYRGEVLGLAGRPGSGVMTLISLLTGELRAIADGALEWFDHSGGHLRGGPRAVGLVPGDRLGAGVVTEFSLAVNLALRRRELLEWPRLLLRKRMLRDFASRHLGAFGIEPADPGLKAGALSGGNIQKVILARELDYADELLVAINPLGGLDVATSVAVSRALRAKAAQGASVIVFSDDLDDLLRLSDRIVVLGQGRVVGELCGQRLSAEILGLSLAGAPA